ncbi:AI-2E family transporter [Acidipila sp. EB88]|uniref:AI-2E family transporter n=1 Tax=Acidipila sp. EB88 TaxID=2305226 RepID=UPI00131598BF|nr:AI-2E family transporter [Acidipila sp. EB88]
MQTRTPPPERTKRQTLQESSIFTREPILLLGLLLAVFYFARPLLIPLALALTFSFLLAPLVSRLEAIRLRRTVSVLLVIFAATAMVAGIVWLVAGQLLTVVNDLPSHAPNIRAKLDKTHVPAQSALGQALVSMEGLSHEFSSNPEQQDAQQRSLTNTATARARSAAGREAARKAASTGHAADPPVPVVIVQTPASESAYLGQVLRPVAGPLGTAGMVLIFTIYMLIKREDLRNRLLLLAGMGRLNLVSHALDDAAARISRYLIANVAVNTGFGIVFAGGLYAIGVPYAFLWGALLALLRTVPYIGPLVGGSLPAIFALIYFPTWWQSLCTIALIGLLEILVSNFLEPWLYGAHTGISELALVAMAIVWTLLWGWPGLALSTPLTVCLIVIGRTMPQMSFLHILLGDDAELAPEARFYERMLAFDNVEAHNVAERFLAQRNPGRGAGSNGAEQRTPLELYDTVLLPAIALAENDRHKGVLREDRASFFMQSVAELVSELTTYSIKTPGAAASALPLSGAADASLAQALREQSCCPVVCIPASDQADEIAATMLAQILEAAGHKTLLLPSSALTPELLARFASEPQTSLFISALPPFAFADAQALYQRLRAALPKNPILVGMWCSQGEADLLRSRFGMIRERDTVATTLDAALHVLHGQEGKNRRLEDIYARSPTQTRPASRERVAQRTPRGE